MWILNFLPDWIFHLIVTAGVLGLIASFILKFIPFVSQYRIPIQAGAIIALVVGIWFEGGISNNNAWLARVKEMEAKVAAAELKSAETNLKLTEQLNKKEKVLKEKNDALVKYVGLYITAKDDAACVIPKSVVVLHDSASRGEVPGSTSGFDGGASQVKISGLTTTVVENYGTYHQVVERLKAWQTWYKEQKEIFESVK